MSMITGVAQDLDEVPGSPTGNATSKTAVWFDDEIR